MTDSIAGDDNSLRMRTNAFEQIRILRDWKDQRDEQSVIIAVLMSSGSIENQTDHDRKVSNDGMSLQLCVVWPRSTVDLILLQKSEIDSDYRTFEHHP